MCISTKNKISAHVSKELKLIRRLADSDIVDVPPKKWFHREWWSRILGYFFRNPSFQYPLNALEEQKLSNVLFEASWYKYWHEMD